jgi:molybdopterin-guanine dinucleotide biosynthesis protein A
MLDRVLAAVADAAPRIVVGPPALTVPPGVLLTQEQPPGGGPVAAAAAGLALAPAGVPVVALLAADLPLLTAEAVTALRRALGDADAALYVDADGRRQLLCGLWRTAALRAAVDRLGAGVTGASVRALLAGVRVAEESWAGTGPPPWFDCDTDADLRRVREWAR